LGCTSTDKFVWLLKKYLDKMQVDGEVQLKLKPVKVRYLLALINWIKEFNFLHAWTVLELQDFADWRRHSLPGTPV
jgi:hypothetical protein